MRNYKNLNVWQKSHELTLRMYKVTENFPRSEQYSLTSQVRRACYSIPMNIAEGCGKSSDPDFARFLDMSSGSASELDYQLLLAKDLGLLAVDDYRELFERLNHVRKMLTSLIKTVRSRKPKSAAPERRKAADAAT